MRISHGTYILKMIDNKGLEDEVQKVNTMRLHVGAFVLSNSKRIMNNFFHVIVGIYTNVAFLEIRIVYIMKIDIGIN